MKNKEIKCNCLEIGSMHLSHCPNNPDTSKDTELDKIFEWKKRVKALSPLYFTRDNGPIDTVAFEHDLKLTIEAIENTITQAKASGIKDGYMEGFEDGKEVGKYFGEIYEMQRCVEIIKNWHIKKGGYDDLANFLEEDK